VYDRAGQVLASTTALARFGALKAQAREED
jgi:hypothetical protein